MQSTKMFLICRHLGWKSWCCLKEVLALQLTANVLNVIWLLLIISDLQSRCPQGKKTILYKRAKLEKLAEYLRHDGLVCCLTVYKDYQRMCCSKEPHLYLNTSSLVFGLFDREGCD